MVHAQNEYKVEVIADSSNEYCGNALTFKTIIEAKEYALDLFSRWLAVRQWRIVNTKTNEVIEQG